MDDSRIPVTIITGFLGSGKTTLLNHIIENNKNKKIAIIENEFGETGIDGELVVGANEGIFELSNGCLCCSLNDDLIVVLNELLNQPKKIDHLIIETTGIADPGPIVMTFLSDFKIQSTFRINAVVALADVNQIEQQLENHSEAARQIGSADLVLLSKVDKADQYSRDTATNIIRRMNPNVEVLESNLNGIIGGLDILGLNSFRKEEVIKAIDKSSKFNSLNLTPTKLNDTNNSLLGNKTKVVQHSSINSLSFTFSEPLDPLRFKIWIDMALNINTCPVYRSKGILNFRDLEDKIVFQAVNNQFVTESGGTWTEQIRESKVVFIGKNLPEDLFKRGLKACTSNAPFDPREFYNEVS